MGRLAQSATFRSLRHRNARVFFAGLLVSNVGTWLQITAMSLLVYRITGRSTDVGITVALQFLPMLLFGTWAGAMADGRDKRTMAIVTQALLAVQALVLGVVDLAGHARVPVVWMLTLAVGIIGAFENPARRGLVTELVEPQDISNATSLNTAVMTGSRIFGPALAAFMVGQVGTAWCFLLNGISFVAVLVSLLAVRPEELHRPPLRPRGGRPVREALSFVTHHPSPLTVLVVMAIVSTFAFNYNVALPAIAHAHWGGDDRFGIVLSTSSLGSLLGSLFMAHFDSIRLRWYFGMCALLGVSGIGLAWAPNLPTAIAWSVPLGVGGAGFISGGNGITQQESPPDMRGRLMALTAVLFLGSTPIGGPITGLIGDRIGPEWSLAYGSVITLIVVAGGASVLARPRPSVSVRRP